MIALSIVRAGPMVTIQDEGRQGYLAHGIGASGPMDRGAFFQAEDVAGCACGAAVEIAPLGVSLVYSGPGNIMGLAGGHFTASIDGEELPWPARVTLRDGAKLDIRPGRDGNYGYLRLNAEIDVPVVLSSRSTNASVGLGGFNGRALREGDELPLKPLLSGMPAQSKVADPVPENTPFRFVWGLHAERFAPNTRLALCEAEFRISSRMDRMGVRLTDPANVFADVRALSLVSEAVVPGDIQILGDGTPIILMRDNQPTGGYPRIGTIVDADLDRFAQMRAGACVRFTPVTVTHAHALGKERRV